MELRIVNFTEDKAKQFIWQEDQKTQMRKIDSKSMNMNSSANIVVTRLNENVRCNLKGLISRNEGTIPFGELAELVDYFYFKGISKEKEGTTCKKRNGKARSSPTKAPGRQNGSSKNRRILQLHETTS
jgi:hypothetical protein